MNFFDELSQGLQHPGTLRIILQWGMIWGLLLGAIALVAAYVWLKDRRVMVCSLLAISLFSGLSLGIDHLAKRPQAQETDRKAALTKLARTRASVSWIFYTSSICALIAAISGVNHTTTAKVFTSLGFVGACASGSVALWLQLRELQIHFPALRLSYHNVTRFHVTLPFPERNNKSC
jgi:small-conductance mechanosensitive channel